MFYNHDITCLAITLKKLLITVYCLVSPLILNCVTIDKTLYKISHYCRNNFNFVATPFKNHVSIVRRLQNIIKNNNKNNQKYNNNNCEVKNLFLKGLKLNLFGKLCIFGIICNISKSSIYIVDVCDQIFNSNPIILSTASLLRARFPFFSERLWPFQGHTSQRSVIP